MHVLTISCMLFKLMLTTQSEMAFGGNCLTRASHKKHDCDDWSVHRNAITADKFVWSPNFSHIAWRIGQLPNFESDNSVTIPFFCFPVRIWTLKVDFWRLVRVPNNPVFSQRFGCFPCTRVVFGRVMSDIHLTSDKCQSNIFHLYYFFL